MRDKSTVILIISLFLVTGAWATTENIINIFNNSNGSFASGPVLLDRAGNLYGMTQNGGTNGCGVVYQLVNRGGTWNENQIYNFTCGSDGGHPFLNGLAIDSAGNLYGTSPSYGAYNTGTVFKLTNSGSTWTLTVLHSFTGGTDGANPQAGVTIDARGDLLGTASNGGGGGCVGGCGVVYRLSKMGSVWKETVLHVFHSNGKDGIYPSSPVTLDKAGAMYGTTVNGGAYGDGAVFRLMKPGKKGVWKETVLHHFYGLKDGCNPMAGIAIDDSGSLYGTTPNCGASEDGTVYQLKKSGTKYKKNILLSFNYANGSIPYDFGTLVLDASGNVYGTTYHGGAYGYGTVFKLAAGSWTYTDLHDFNSNGTDGDTLYGGVALDSSGNVYGETSQGGNSDNGIVYQITP